jgi:hypothetical protein
MIIKDTDDQMSNSHATATAAATVMLSVLIRLEPSTQRDAEAVTTNMQSQLPGNSRVGGIRTVITQQALSRFKCRGHASFLTPLAVSLRPLIGYAYWALPECTTV